MDKVLANTLKAMWAMTLLAGIEAYALMLGIDGAGLAGVVAVLAGLGGLAGGVAVSARSRREEEPA